MPELTIVRTFDAPRERVWKAWSDPGLIVLWWGPKGYTAPFARIDFRVGGRFLLDMRSPEGLDIWGTGTYQVIEPPERLVCTDSFADAEGNVVPASRYGMTGPFPMELKITLTLEDAAGKRTKMTLVHSGMPAGEQTSAARQGWNESFDKLDAALTKGLV